MCPVLRNTPPSFATNGNICPGLKKSSDFASGFISLRTVLARSAAEIPDVTPSPLRSIETVKAVPMGSVLLLAIGYRSNFLQRFSVIGVQISPRPSFAIKLIISGVTISAAPTKSPSFSRFSSSTTIITLPFLISSIASSIESRRKLLSIFNSFH